MTQGMPLPMRASIRDDVDTLIERLTEFANRHPEEEDICAGVMSDHGVARRAATKLAELKIAANSFNKVNHIEIEAYERAAKVADREFESLRNSLRQNVSDSIWQFQARAHNRRLRIAMDACRIIKLRILDLAQRKANEQVS